jgi:anti-sigma B factor antagonist
LREENAPSGGDSLHIDDLNIHLRSADDETQIFELKGSLDIATSPTVRAALLDAAERGEHRIVVDLSGLDFIDSTGLGALIGGQRRAKENSGEVRLVAREGQILRLLRITGLLTVFGVYHTLDDALAGSGRIEGL